MSNHFDFGKKHSYFEGWYFKHQKGDAVIAFIPSISINSAGEKAAHIQIIMKDQSYQVEYPIEDFKINHNRTAVKIGRNVFSKNGVSIHIKENGILIEGNLMYGLFAPIRYNIMGPFAYWPFMECNHGVISLYHSIHGFLRVNHRIIDFQNGMGYMEKDWGRSFPKTYLWTHCNQFQGKRGADGRCSIMASAAEIPFMNRTFKGCICIVHLHGREYRLATYLGVRILECSEQKLILKQGVYLLIVELLDKNPQNLLAPDSGKMSRMIHESVAAKARYRFYNRGALIFDKKSSRASFEYVG